MPRDGSGNFSRSVTPPSAGDTARAADYNSEQNDIATALSDSINKNGTKAFAANQSMGGFRLTNVADATAAGDAVSRSYGDARYQGLDAKLSAIVALTWADDRMLDLTGTSSIAVVTYATVLTNLGGVPTTRTVSAGAGLTGGGDLSANRTLAADFATSAQIIANTADKVVGTDEAWASVTPVSLTDAATIAVDMGVGINFDLTIGGNRTLGQPTNTKVGQGGSIKITQDGTGSRTLAYHADWKFDGGVDPTLSTTAGAVDVLYYKVLAANFIHGSLNKALA